MPWTYQSSMLVLLEQGYDMARWLGIAANLGTFASAVVATVAIVVGLHTYRDQTNAQIYLEYTRRYDEVMASFPGASHRARLDIATNPPPPSEELTAAVLRLLNLYSQEFYLARSGYLAEDIWQIWEAGLQRTLRSPLLRREWVQLRDEFVAYPAFVAYVDAAQ